MSMVPEDVVSKYGHLVRRRVEYFRGRLPASIDKGDLLQSGMVGLLQSASTYERRNGATFETHAGNRIYGSMLDEIRRARPGTRHAKNSTITYSIESEYPLHQVASQEASADEVVFKSKLLISLGKAMDALSPRERLIMTLYYQDGFSMDEIGQVLGKTEGRISQIHKSALSALTTGMAL